jgi:tRNA/rRNA methyltransferase
MAEKIRPENIAIVLFQPRVPENIGAAARAMCNMGFKRLLVVAPRDLDMERVERMATHAAMAVVRNMAVFDTLPEALSGFSWVVGTTARLGGGRQVIPSPARLVEALIPVSEKNRVAVLFGPEDRGLTNEDLRLCHEVVTIPTADFSSLNLAQAVMVICYELFKASREDVQSYSPRLASRHELDGMYEQLKDILVRIDYINKEKPDYWLNKVRHFFTRLQLRAREVSIIRGICRQISWYSGKCYRDGVAAGRAEERKIGRDEEPMELPSLADKERL